MSGAVLGQPTPWQLRAAAEHLAAEGLAPEEAAAWAERLGRQMPHVVAMWDRAPAALRWLQRHPQLGEGLSVEEVLRRGPHLLSLDVPRLEMYWRFLEARHGFEGGAADAGSGAAAGASILESLHALRAAAAQRQQLEQAA
jgi:hypothetical protein